MPAPLNVSMASLYERQDALWHPLSWPQRLLSAPQAALHKLDAYAAATAPTTAGIEATLAHKMATGASTVSHSPLARALAAPVTALALGGAAPVALAATLSMAALTVGSGGAALAKQLQANSADPQSSDARPLPWRLLSTVLAYGTVGCVTELLGAALGRLGAQWRTEPGGGTLQSVLGRTCEGVGYTAALLTGAALTVLRCAVAATYTFLTGAMLLSLGTAGAIGGLGQHVMHLLGNRAPAPTPQAS